MNMKSLNEYLHESLIDFNNMNEGKISSEDDLRDAMKAKFEEVFKDKLDEDKMNKTIDGFCKDHKKEIEDGKFGELIGMFNASFAK